MAIKGAGYATNPFTVETYDELKEICQRIVDATEDPGNDIFIKVEATEWDMNEIYPAGVPTINVYSNYRAVTIDFNNCTINKMCIQDDPFIQVYKPVGTYVPQVTLKNLKILNVDTRNSNIIKHYSNNSDVKHLDIFDMIISGDCRVEPFYGAYTSYNAAQITRAALKLKLYSCKLCNSGLLCRDVNQEIDFIQNDVDGIYPCGTTTSDASRHSFGDCRLKYKFTNSCEVHLYFNAEYDNSLVDITCPQSIVKIYSPESGASKANNSVIFNIENMNDSMFLYQSGSSWAEFPEGDVGIPFKRCNTAQFNNPVTLSELGFSIGVE